MTNEEFIKSISLEGEEWRDVPTWEGYYMVSSFGRMVSVERTIISKNGRKRHFPCCLLKANKGNHHGIAYNYIKMCASDRKETLGIHRLVAKVFIPNPNNYPEVDHIDRNGLNNRVTNLRWCNRRINMNNTNTRKVASLSKTGKPVPTLYKKVVQLKDNNVIEIFESCKAAAEKINCARGGITQACSNPSKSRYGYQWMYLSDYESLINKSKNDLPTLDKAGYPQ